MPLSASASVELVELIPPFHERVYRMTLEHVGFVVGADLDDFSKRHRAVLTAKQFQSSANEPVDILFDDYTHVLARAGRAHREQAVGCRFRWKATVCPTEVNQSQETSCRYV